MGLQPGSQQSYCPSPWALCPAPGQALSLAEHSLNPTQITQRAGDWD